MSKRRSRNVPTFLFGSGAIALALLLIAGGAGAHTPGISLADFEVGEDGLVQARLTFASTESIGGLRVDRDRDGIVSPDEMSAAHDDLRALALDGVGVDADGSACTAAFRDASLTEVDGIAIFASYLCPSNATEIEVTLYYLSASTSGQSRRGIARIVAGSATTEAVLNADHRAIALRLPGREPRAPGRSMPLLASLVAAGAVALLARSSRRWRGARPPWQNRAS